MLEGLLAARVQAEGAPAPPASPAALLSRSGRARALWLRDPAYAQQPAEAPSVELRLLDDQVIGSSLCTGLSNRFEPLRWFLTFLLPSSR